MNKEEEVYGTHIWEDLPRYVSALWEGKKTKKGQKLNGKTRTARKLKISQARAQACHAWLRENGLTRTESDPEGELRTVAAVEKKEMEKIIERMKDE